MYENDLNKNILGDFMKHETELNFVKTLLNNFHISFTTLKSPVTLPFSPMDYGLRLLFQSDFNYSGLSERFEEICQPNTIYRVKDFSLYQFCSHRPIYSHGVLPKSTSGYFR